MSGPENDLSSTLARQAEQFARRGGADLDIAQVVSRAGEIRRGRRMRATMAMAAVVLAVAVPVGVTVLNDPTTPKPPSVARQPDTSQIVVDGLKEGRSPTTGYAAGDTISDADGNDVQLDEDRVRALAPINGGFLVALDLGDGDLRARFVGTDGAAVPKLWTTTGSFAVSSGGNVGAFAETDGTVRVVQDADSSPAAQVFSLGQVPGQNLHVLGVQGEDCSSTGTCTVYVATENGVGGSQGYTPETWVASPGADPVKIDSEVYAMDDIGENGSRLGRVAISETGACYGVETEDGTQLWKDCERGAREFSPDGKFVLGGSNFLDGVGDGQLTVLDAATGAPVLELRTRYETIIYDRTWEDSEHILAVVAEKNRWAVIRFGLNGSREYALPPITAGYADDANAPYTLAKR